MIVLAATHGVTFAIAVGAALLASALSVGGLLLTRTNEKRRLRLLAATSIGHDQIASAAAAAEADGHDFLREVLLGAVADVTADQKLETGRVRGALYKLGSAGSPQLLSDQAVNFDPSQVAVLKRRGSEPGVHEAFKSAGLVIVVFEPEEMAGSKPEENPDAGLRWRIAVPVLGSPEEPTWVLAVDGVIEGRSAEQLRSAASRLLYYREILELFLKTLAKKSK
jgi:hypothetical protein